MASTTADAASKPLTAGQRADKAEALVRDLLHANGVLEATNSTLAMKVVEQEKVLQPIREDLSVIREKRNMLQRLVDAARNSSVADWLRFRREAMSGHDPHEPHAPAAHPPKAKANGGGGGGVPKNWPIILIGLLVVAAVLGLGGWGASSLFGNHASAPGVMAPAEVIPPAPVSVDTGPAPTDIPAASLSDTPENRGAEMAEANCSATLKTTTGDSFTPWDDMQYNSSFYSYELALQHNCGVATSKLSGDRTPDPSGEMTDAELNELNSLLAKKARGE